MIFEPNASAEQIFRVFRTAKYRNRIAVLHFCETGADVPAAWHAAEQGEDSRPLLIVLDQVEEAYTLPPPSEFGLT